MGAGERLAWFLQLHALYLGANRGWAWWNGTHYEVGEEAERLVHRYAHRSSRKICAQALKDMERLAGMDPDDKDWQRTKKQQLAKAGKLGGIKAAIEIASHHPSIACDPMAMDAHPYLINCANGVLDVTTMQLHPHDRKWKLTAYCPFAWNPDADMGKWEEVVLELMCGDAELVAILQRAAGWTLLGEGTTRLQRFLFCYGRSNSGKGVFTRTLAKLLGRSQAMTAPFSMIGEAALGGPNSALAQSEGMRMVLVADTGGRPRWDGEVLKAFTGGDWVSCSEKHKKQKSFRPIGTLWLCANDKPIPQGAGKNAIFNRCVLIPFRQEYSQDPEKIRKGLALPMNPDLERELIDVHGEGVLRWAVIGAQRYLDERTLGTCAEVERQMIEYRDHSKVPLEEFADLYLRTEYDDVEDGELAFEHDDWNEQFINRDDVHKAFSWWCEDVGYQRGEIGTPTRTSRTMNSLIDNVSRFKRVRKDSQFCVSVTTGKRGRAWRRMCWTREGMSVLHRAGGRADHNEREPF